MSEINANIVVQQIGANIVVEQNSINITPEDIQLRVFAGGYATPSGNIYEVQYNNGGILAGNPALKFYPSNTTIVTDNIIVTNDSNLGDAIASNLYANAGTIGASLLTGTLTTTSQPNVTSLGTLTGLTVNGNVTANYFLGNGAFLTGIDASSISNGNSNVKVYGNSNVAISVSGNSNVATVTGTGVNISGYLTATGNIAFNGANVSLGSSSNLKILGGLNGYFLQTDGTGNLTWTVGGNGGGGGNGVPGGANTQIQFNDVGNFAGNAGFTFDKTTGTLNSIKANIANVVIDAGNITTPGNLGNITGANVIECQEIQTIAINIPQGYNPNAATVGNTTIQFKLPIIINGNTYYIGLTGNI